MFVKLGVKEVTSAARCFSLHSILLKLFGITVSFVKFGVFSRFIAFLGYLVVFVVGFESGDLGFMLWIYDGFESSFLLLVAFHSNQSS